MSSEIVSQAGCSQLGVFVLGCPVCCRAFCSVPGLCRMPVVTLPGGDNYYLQALPTFHGVTTLSTRSGATDRMTIEDFPGGSHRSLLTLIFQSRWDHAWGSGSVWILLLQFPLDKGHRLASKKQDLYKPVGLSPGLGGMGLRSIICPQKLSKS